MICKKDDRRTSSKFEKIESRSCTSTLLFRLHLRTVFLTAEIQKLVSEPPMLCLSEINALQTWCQVCQIHSTTIMMLLKNQIQNKLGVRLSGTVRLRCFSNKQSQQNPEPLFLPRNFVP